MAVGEDPRIPQSVAALLRPAGVVLLVTGIVLAALFAVTRTWPPVVVVESGSMQHSDETSFLGVADTGDVVLLVGVSEPADVVTYVEGRARGYATYGDFGDVIAFTPPQVGRSIIHRPVLRLLWNETARGFDIPSLDGLTRGADWNATAGTPYGLGFGDEVVLHKVGFRDLNVTLRMSEFLTQVVASRCLPENPCYITMGDNNAPSHDPFLVRHSWIQGTARGEVPWLGLVKLLLTGTYAWGDSQVPSNSWTFLAVALTVLVGGPLALDVLRHVRGQRGGEPPESGLESLVAALEERWEEREGGEGPASTPEPEEEGNGQSGGG